MSRRVFVAIAAAGSAAACQSAVWPPVSNTRGLSLNALSQPSSRSLALDVRKTRMSENLFRYKALVTDAPFRNSLLASEILREFVLLGAKADIHPFSSFTTELPAVNLWVNGMPVVARGLMHSRTGRVRGPLKSVDVDFTGNIQAEAVEGSVVLVERGIVRFQKIVADLAAQGAVAVVFYDHRPGLVYGTLLQPSQIPSLVITRESGQRLLFRVADSPLEAVVDVEVAPRSFQGLNLTAFCAGASDRRIIVSTPADAVRGDVIHGGNADGFVLMSELIRWCTEQQRQHNFEFIVFDGTHGGYFGSRWHVASVVGKATDHIDAVVTFDRPGADLPLRVGATQMMVELLNTSVAAKFNDLSVTANFGVGRGDHDVFAAKGVPFVFAARGPGPIVNIDALELSLEVVSTVLETLDETSRFSSD
jgi:hypothetical protein